MKKQIFKKKVTLQKEASNVGNELSRQLNILPPISSQSMIVLFYIN